MALTDVEHKVSDKMNIQHIEEYTDEEIEIAMNQMHPTKTPGPNGMAPIFYQNFWKIVGKNICNVVRRALQIGIFPPSLNHTHITPILKKKSPENISDFRPISLCNVLYKIFPKTLTNRFKKILPQII